MQSKNHQIGDILYFYHEKFNQVVKVRVTSETKAEIIESGWNHFKYVTWVLLSEVEHLSDSPMAVLNKVWADRVNQVRNDHARLVSKTAAVYRLPEQS